MDKLQPILKHHFWILAFLVLPLGLWGYYSANSSLIAATDARQSELDQVYAGIPQGNTPNQTWEAEMKVVADEYEQIYIIATSTLHEDQEARMDWPPIMSPRPDEYRGAWHGDRQFAYTQVYPELLNGVWRRYEPVVTLAEGEDRSWVNWDEKVIIQPDAIQPVHQFGVRRATDAQIWDAQEDIWLHRLIADAVVRTNDDADGVYTSVVKAIMLVELMGGDGKPVAAGSTSTGGGASSGPSLSGSSVDDYQAGMRGGGQGGMTAVEVAFDPAEEIGAGGRAAQSGAGGSYGGPGEMEMPSGGSGRGSSRQPAEILRYVDFNENDRARVRAFYMSVIVHQSKFPEFLVELCNSDWPIQVIRFNVGPNPYYRDPTGTSPSGVMGGYGSSGPGTMGSRPTMGGRPMGGRPMGGRPMIGPGPMSPMSPMGSGPVGSYGSGRGMPGQDIDGPLNNPDLVQLDLLGLITIFNPTTRPEALADATESEVAIEEAIMAEDVGTAEGDGTEIPVPVPSDEPMSDDAPVDANTTEEVPMESVDSTETTDPTGTSDPETTSEEESVPSIDEAQ